MITIHPLTTHDEIFAVEQLQRDAWGVPEVDVVPLHMLITPPRHGGLLLGAFDGERLAGFVFGFLGLTHDGRLKHCSHMAGVHPDYRDQGVGYSLKLAQREHVLAQGIDLVTWTFDPLETRNANLNFHKLGVVCNSYIRNLYGAMRGAINAGLPSDRLEVAWWIRSQQVVDRLQGGVISPASDHLLIEVPANFQSIKATDMALALRWRLTTRQRFEDAFAQGYMAADLVKHGGGLAYVLERPAT
jgi:predicted GNAT superfamily acetyltransferase